MFPKGAFFGLDENDMRKKKRASKTKYTCPSCGLNAWAKPDAPLVCGDCQEPMQSKADNFVQPLPG
jgi:transcription elongation factor Elf1